MTHKRQAGFSLVELLVVLGVVGILVGVAIPNLLASRRAANEASAQSSLRAVHTSQAIFQATTGGGALSVDLAALNAQALIDPVLSNGTKSGYTFAVVEASGSGSAAVFGCYAFPSNSSGISQSGDRRFGITEAGVLRGDASLLTIPTTRALINSMAPLGK